MSYLVLARKWRPQTFSDLVGQEHVKRTLENAIAQNRVAHAFLFTGVRGVGKTTSARILAKALNCEKGPTGSPCLECAACREIAAGSDTDVQEIDGASYNGVNEVRDLQSSLPYLPTRDRFKIYIVDEVHMLSQAAWNAFLKTLEEPPPHVKFIFATTEVHKVPITILSRCQRYDFKMIPAQTIASRVKYVLEQEKIEADESAVSLVAREAAGSMRDAMSLLDQAIAWGGQKLVGEEVARVLGVASRAVLHELCAALVEGKAEECLRIVAQLAENGYDLTHAARDVLSHLRDLVVARVCSEPEKQLDMADGERKATIELARSAEVDDLVRLHQGFSRSFDDVVRSPSPRAGLEMLLVRLAKRPALLPLDELLGRLADLERRLGGGAPAPQPPRGGPGPGPGAGRPAPPAGRPVPSAAPAAAPSPAPAPARPAPAGSGNQGGAPVASAAPLAASPIAEASVGRRANLAVAASPEQAPASQPRPVPAPPPPVSLVQPASFGQQSAPTPAQPPAHAPAPPPALHAAPAPSAQGPRPPTTVRPVLQPPPPSPDPPPDEAPATTATRPAPRPGAQPRGPRATASSFDPSQPLPEPPPGVDFAVWSRIVDRVRAERPSLASALEFGAPMAIGPTGLVLAFPPGSFVTAQASEPRHAELLTRSVRDELGPEATLSIELTEASRTALTLAKIKAAEQHARREAARRRVIEHPLVKAAIEILGAELRDVKFDDEGKGSQEKGK